MNKLIETGGTATVIIRAICDFNDHKEGDVLAVLEDVIYSCNYYKQTSEAASGTERYLSYYDKAINTLKLSNISLNNGLLNLLQVLNTEEECDYSVVDTFVKTSNNIYYLTKVPSDIATIKTLPKYDYEYFDRSNSIQIDSADIVDNFKVIYNIKSSGLEYNLNEQINIPYVSLEIICQGNVSKETGKTIIKLPKVKLMDMPQISTYKNSTSYYVIDCEIIYDDENNQILGIANE